MPFVGAFSGNSIAKHISNVRSSAVRRARLSCGDAERNKNHSNAERKEIHSKRAHELKDLSATRRRPVQFWGEASWGTAPLTSSEAWASRPGEGGGLDTSVQNYWRNCLGTSVPLCCPRRPPRAGAVRGSRGRWRWRCGRNPPLIRCHASLSFCTWSVYSETIFSPKTKETVVSNGQIVRIKGTVAKGFKQETSRRWLQAKS